MDAGLLPDAVIVKSRANEVGADFLIRKKGAGPFKCVFSPKAGDVRVPASGKDVNSYSFLALRQGKLLIDDGTSASGRELVIIDARTGKTLRSFASIESPTVKGGFAIIMSNSKVRATAGKCPDMDAGLLPDAVIGVEQKIDLATMVATPTGKERCIYLE
jgi:hypothetical protein